jgi:hypothetical protein
MKSALAWHDAEALRERIGAPMTDQERVDYDHAVVRLRSKLNDTEFKAAWREGSLLIMESAIQFALSP